MYVCGLFDESGTHDNSPVICIAGYIAKETQWVHFSRNWQEVLDRYGIDCFHMTDFESRRGVFAKLNKNERVTLMQSLITIINVRVGSPLIARVPLSDYQEVIHRVHGDKISGPYIFCGMLAMIAVRKWCHNHSHTEPVAFFFDQGAKYSGQFRVAYDKACKDTSFAAENLLGPIIMGDRRILKPLQAADLIAYEAYKESEITQTEVCGSNSKS